MGRDLPGGRDPSPPGGANRSVRVGRLWRLSNFACIRSERRRVGTTAGYVFVLALSLDTRTAVVVLVSRRNWYWATKPSHSWKEGIVRNIIVPMVMATLSTGCSRSRTYWDPPAPNSQTANLSQQKMCADQALKTFKDTSDARGFTNHYDVTAKVCYMEITSQSEKVGGGTYGNLILDAFEGRVYGIFTSESAAPEKASQRRTDLEGCHPPESLGF